MRRTVMNATFGPLEARGIGISGSASNERIELYNFLTSAYETVDLRPSTTSHSVAQVSITNNPQQFVQSGTRSMRTRMRYKANGLLHLSLASEARSHLLDHLPVKMPDGCSEMPFIKNACKESPESRVPLPTLPPECIG